MNETPITKIHSYSVAVAQDVGINAAVIFNNIVFWVEQNYANDRNCVNGKYWTYNTIKAFQTMFPEMTANQINYALQKLESKGYIESAFLNKDARDRTKWYTVCDFDRWIKNTSCISENSEMALENSEMFNINNNIYNTTDNNNTVNKQTDSNIYASSGKKPSEDNIYASAPKEQDVEIKPKQSRFIPKDYTYKQLEDHIRPVYADILKAYCNDGNYKTALDSLITITLNFYKLYEQNTGHKHKILSDMGYRNIVDCFMNPPDIMNDPDVMYDAGCYAGMAEQYFKIDYNKYGKYNKPVEKSLSHFMRCSIRENLFYQTCL
ncbi:MAG: hypothetical protein ACI4EU_02925 [Butyrivibrio sp.]